MADALVVIPGHGSIWLSDAKVVGGHVVGTAERYPSQMEPVDAISVPVSCVMRWEPHPPPPTKAQVAATPDRRAPAAPPDWL